MLKIRNTLVVCGEVVCQTVHSLVALLKLRSHVIAFKSTGHKFSPVTDGFKIRVLCHPYFNSEVEIPCKVAVHVIISCCLNSIDLSELRSCYDDVIKNMPEKYYETVQLLERELCDTHISSIFECPPSTTANQIILECLMEQVNCKADILDLCEILLKVKNAPQLTQIIEHLKISKLIYVRCAYISSVGVL